VNSPPPCSRRVRRVSRNRVAVGSTSAVRVGARSERVWVVMRRVVGNGTGLTAMCSLQRYYARGAGGMVACTHEDQPSACCAFCPAPHFCALVTRRYRSSSDEGSRSLCSCGPAGNGYTSCLRSFSPVGFLPRNDVNMLDRASVACQALLRENSICLLAK
jgi:hypothetical protein